MSAKGSTEFAQQKDLILSRPLVRFCYDLWYRNFTDDIASVPADGKPVKIVELGSGGSYYQQVDPRVITSDVVPGLGDMVIDARELPFADASVDAYVMSHSFHHIPDIRRFLHEADRTLKPGGVVSLIEVARTPLARFLFSRFHPEPFDDRRPEWDFESQHNMDANQALSWIIFFRDAEKFRREFPNLTLERWGYLPWLTYLLSGGVTKSNLVPRFLNPLIFAAEWVTIPLRRIFALHWHLRIRKSARAPA